MLDVGLEGLANGNCKETPHAWWPPMGSVRIHFGFERIHIHFGVVLHFVALTALVVLAP